MEHETPRGPVTERHVINAQVVRRAAAGGDPNEFMGALQTQLGPSTYNQIANAWSNSWSYTSTSSTWTSSWITTGNSYPLSGYTWGSPQYVRQGMYTLGDAQRNMGQQGLQNMLAQQVQRSQRREPPSPETARRAREENERLDREYRARVELVDAAKRRARDLLYSCLTEQQRADLEGPRRCFRVVSDMGGIFEIEPKQMHNVFALDHTAKRVEEWCVTPQGDFPVHDVMLAQKLALETDSLALAERANITDLRTGRLVRRSQIQYRWGVAPDYLRLGAAE